MQPPLRLFFGVLWEVFLVLWGKLKTGFRGRCWQTKSWVQLFGEESRMLLLKLARNESNSFSPPFLLCLPYVEILMPHLTLRIV